MASQPQVPDDTPGDTPPEFPAPEGPTPTGPGDPVIAPDGVVEPGTDPLHEGP